MPYDLQQSERLINLPLAFVCRVCRSAFLKAKFQSANYRLCNDLETESRDRGRFGHVCRMRSVSLAKVVIGTTNSSARSYRRMDGDY